MLLLESLHVIGLNVMVFIVIPNMDPISGLLYTLTVGVVPAVLKVIYPTAKKEGRLSRFPEDGQSILMSVIVTIASVIGAVGQFAALGKRFDLEKWLTTGHFLT